MLKRLSSRRIAAPLAALLLFPSCLAPRSSQEHSPAAVMLDIPPITQEDAYDCGLASIAMLGAHYDVEIPAEQREVLRRKASDQRGLSGNDVAAALAKFVKQ